MKFECHIVKIPMKKGNKQCLFDSPTHGNGQLYKMKMMSDDKRHKKTSSKFTKLPFDQ